MIVLRALLLFVLFLLSPVLLAGVALIFALADCAFALVGTKRVPGPGSPVRNDCASVLIPNWNGRDLLEKYLPSVVDAAGRHAGSEVIVVDNASSDGSAEFLAEFFPEVRVIRLQKNLGFGGGSNLGFREAKNDIVVLLNSDMRVEADFLAPLLEPFTDPLVFAVACQIFFSDPEKRREETGLTQGWWESGRIRVRHREDSEVAAAFPCFYAGGGSSAYDRNKFLELGGFDEIYRPFYYEDTDLGLLAWKRGWKVLYQPASIVFHEHRGTIGRKFSRHYVQRVIKKNQLLFVWKNIHSWSWLGPHFGAVFASAARSLFLGDAPGAFSLPGLAGAVAQLAAVCRARWHAKALGAVEDREAFRRPLGTYFRDRFQAGSEPVPERLRVLFAAPYPIEPPVHGGAVFMKLTLEELAPSADVHLVGMVDRKDQLEAQRGLLTICKSIALQVRLGGMRRELHSPIPHAVREFADDDFAWALHRVAYQKQVDVIQLEYLQFAQYGARYRHLPCFLFEHDVYFQSVERVAARQNTWLRRNHYRFEYLRALRYELRVFNRFTAIQVCSEENKRAITAFLPELSGKIDSTLRAGIQPERFPFRLRGRRPETMLFVGSFRHGPNVEAITWFFQKVLPHVLAQHPDAQLVIVGSDPPPAVAFLKEHPRVRFTGYVADIREPLEQYAVFVCPILSGSGVRVKLLEAFASGIPCISTRLGAEGLAVRPGDICELGDTPEEFAAGANRLLRDPLYAEAVAERARQFVETERNGHWMTARLYSVYREAVVKMRSGEVQPGFGPESSPDRSRAASF